MIVGSLIVNFVHTRATLGICPHAVDNFPGNDVVDMNAHQK